MGYLCWSTTEKARLVESVAASSDGLLCGQNLGFAPIQLFDWKRRMSAGVAAAAQIAEDVIGASLVPDLKSAFAIVCGSWQPDRDTLPFVGPLSCRPSRSRCGSTASLARTRGQDRPYHARHEPDRPFSGGTRVKKKSVFRRDIFRESTRVSTNPGQTQPHYVGNVILIDG